MVLGLLLAFASRYFVLHAFGGMHLLLLGQADLCEDSFRWIMLPCELSHNVIGVAFYIYIYLTTIRSTVFITHILSSGLLHTILYLSWLQQQTIQTITESKVDDTD